MKSTYTCKKVSLSDSIKAYTEKKISKLDRYFGDENASASVTFSVEKNHLCSVELTIRGSGTLLRAQTEAPDGDMRGAVDAAVGYIERQILKNKTRGEGGPHRPHKAVLREAHERRGGHLADEPAGSQLLRVPQQRGRQPLYRL